MVLCYTQLFTQWELDRIRPVADGTDSMSLSRH